MFLSTVGEIYVHKGYCMIEMAMFHDFMQPLISLKIFFSNLKFFLGFDLTEKHNGSIPRNACVACER